MSAMLGVKGRLLQSDPENEAEEQPTESKYGNCLIWFDGCNNCKVLAGDTLSCGNIVCTEKKPEYCLYGGKSTQQDDCYMTLSKRMFNESEFMDWEGQVDYLFINEKPQ